MFHEGGVKPDAWPELVWAVDYSRATVSRAVTGGTLTFLAPGLYTSSKSPERVVSRNALRILAREMPGALIADRSAGSPGSYIVDNNLYVIHSRRHPLLLPGLTIHPRRGPGALPGDIKLADDFHVASPARTMLESLARTAPRYFTAVDVELWIERILNTSNGEANVNALRDNARQIAPRLRTTRSMKELNHLISAALNTGDTVHLQTSQLLARSTGAPVDRHRIELFTALCDELNRAAPQPEPFTANSPRRDFLPHFEAYFSNYIEGTEFTVDEAMAIMTTGAPLLERPADAHDILGTFRIVNDPELRAVTPANSRHLLALITSHHRVLMAGRPEMNPGCFKDKANRAGNSEVVSPADVEGTLAAGFDLADTLIDPFHRAVYMMFLLSEVHPFRDGNGRVARIMMNAELSAQYQPRIIIPTVYRNEYLTALRAGTRNSHFAPLIAVLSFAQKHTNRVDYTTVDTAEADLTRTNAFKDSNDAEREGFRLTLPQWNDRLVAPRNVS